MDDLEARLRSFAAHRANQVPPFEPTAGRATGRSRRRPLLLAAAVVVVLALVAAGVAVIASSGGNDASVRVPPATDVPKTTPATMLPSETTVPSPAKGCSGPAGSVPATTPRTGTGIEPVNGGSTVLANVQTQRSDCEDAATFLFGNGMPSWSVAYTDTGEGTATGRTQVLVRFEGAQLLTDNFGGAEYSSTDLRPVAPARISSVALDDSSADPMTWRITLDRERPFFVEVREDSIAIRILSPPPEAVVCNIPSEHLRIPVPAAWFTETSPYWMPCHVFARAPFVMTPATDGLFSGFVWASVVTDVSPTFTGTVVDEHSAVVAGRPATVTTVQATEQPIIPDGALSYRYVVDWGPYGYLVMSTVGMAGPEFDADKAGLDAIAATLQYTE